MGLFTLSPKGHLNAITPTHATNVTQRLANPVANSVFDEIAQAKKLFDADIITQEEFTAIKAKLIDKM